MAAEGCIFLFSHCWDCSARKKKNKDVRPIFLLAYWETDVKGFSWLFFQPAGIVTILLAVIENNNEKN